MVTECVVGAQSGVVIVCGRWCNRQSYEMFSLLSEVA